MIRRALLKILTLSVVKPYFILKAKITGNHYVGCNIYYPIGNGETQERVITRYNPSTKMTTIIQNEDKK